MLRLGRSGIAAFVSAAIIAALAVPASAASTTGTAVIVNGIPGSRVDLCINGKEVSSGLRYGGHKIITQATGVKTLKVFRRDTRTCRGALLAHKKFLLQDGGDLTIIATKRFPKRVLVFDNHNLSTLPSALIDHSVMLLRHAGDLGDTVFKFGSVRPEPVETAADPVWVKGDERLRGATWPAGSCGGSR